MRAARTLLRKTKVDQYRRMNRGKAKPGSIRRRVTDISHHVLFTDGDGREVTYAMAGLEADYHATKGYRVRWATLP